MPCLSSSLYMSNEDEIFYKYQLRSMSVMSRIVMNQTNYLRERYTWNPMTRSWDLFASIPRDNCDKYGLCGAYGNCIIGESPICQCLKDFRPKNLKLWNGPKVVCVTSL